MPYNRGDILLLLFPNSDLRTAKRRPVLVVQADELGTGLPQLIVAMISSNMARAGHRSRVAIRTSDAGFAATGLLSDSGVVTDNLATVRTREIQRRLGHWSSPAEVDAALRHTLGL
ncbi:MAG: type II toxin-antitoxin system PemK/MazF family toxin [Chthoniobacterales bacterium]|nr:type II toxin-antitoxin system PemK/MazF family toxin [Chthoniobacterales bacterium]